MPRFFLHIVSSREFIADEEWLDLPNLAAARREAIRGARGIMAAEIETGALRLDQAVVIHDSLGRRVIRLEFEQAIDIRRSEADALRCADGANDA